MYKLGENVTHLFRAENPTSRVELSLWLPGEEFVALSKLADAEGKNIAQVAREGIRARLKRKGITAKSKESLPVKTPDGSQASLGAGAPSTRNDLAVREVESNYSQVEPIVAKAVVPPPTPPAGRRVKRS